MPKVPLGTRRTKSLVQALTDVWGEPPVRIRNFGSSSYCAVDSGSRLPGHLGLPSNLFRPLVRIPFLAQLKGSLLLEFVFQYLLQLGSADLLELVSHSHRRFVELHDTRQINRRTDNH